MTEVQLNPYSVQCPPTIASANPAITFCGEAPGRQEIAWHECPQCKLAGSASGSDHPGQCRTHHVNLVKAPQGFVGGSGQMLQRLCREVRIPYLNCNRTNVVKRRPPNDDFGGFYIDKRDRKRPTEELMFWRELLRKELENFTPRVLVACGDEALKATTGESGIMKWAGSILQSTLVRGMKVIPVMHPAYVMRNNWEYYYILKRFLKRVAIEMDSPNIVQQEPSPNFTIRPRFDQALEWLTHIQISAQPWDIDIETRGDTLTCFAISSESRPDSAICIPIQTTTGPYWSEAEEKEIWKALARAFKGNPLCENQNIIYDLDYLLDIGCEPSGVAFDSQIAMNVAYPEFPKALHFSTAFYTNIPYYKDDGKTWKKRVPDEKVWRYNCMDVWSNAKVSRGLKQDMSEMGLLEIYQNRSLRMLPIALEMQRNRLKINKEWHSKLAGYLYDEIETTHRELTNELGSYEINVRSSAQTQHVLYEMLRLPQKKKRGTERVTTQENAIKELRAAHPDTKALNLIIAERHLKKKQSDWINLKLDSDGHYPYMPQIGAAVTGRWSFTRSPKWRGSNAQTVPKIMRLMMEPPEGRVFVQRDLSQAEVRYVATESNCLFLNNIFASGVSVHKAVGKRLFGNEPVKDSLEYDTAKSIVHAYDYMMGPQRMALEANISFKFADQVHKAYSVEVPEINRWHQWIKEEVIKSGRLTTPFGRVRQCFAACGMVANTGQLGDDIWRDLVSYRPQATVPDIINEGMWQTWNELGWVLFHQQGHDSHLDSILPAQLSEYAEKTEAFHKVPIRIKGLGGETELTIPSELSWGYLWGAMKKWETGDQGTREEWETWIEKEEIFDEGAIKKRLYGLF